ncbi:MAG: hypothetical protein B7O98_05220 [Zestosphaera tikiterensis]|uniref:MobA-like NTP transferase domain-containing protein n=1 Tax=Zestosphaera tikiterensis TaxID=1973259 RepID=A0A2R7Y5N9_9CREN|nr:MAG: hypothetical protein B7O98_05220 [Zestosphaera tikiterensis]
MFITAVILAAGKSTRFPGNKMLYEVVVDGVKDYIVRHTVVKFLNSRTFDEVAVVVGHESQSVTEVLKDLKVKFIYNPDYERGMSSSVIKGVLNVMDYSDIIAIHPADVPLIKVETLVNVVNRAKDLYKVSREFIVIPKHATLGKGGHPLVVGRGLFKELLNIREEERGLKGFLSRFKDRIDYVVTDDAGIIADIDTLDDIFRLNLATR